MSSEPEPTKSNSTSVPDIGQLIQARALINLERANAKPYRSPRRIVLTVLAVLITMTLFLMFINAGVKVTHRIIDIWTPVIFDTKKPAAESQKPTADPNTNPNAAYMISVVPSTSSSSSSSSRNTK